MRVRRIAVAVLAVTLMAAACSDDESDDSSVSVDLPDGAAAVVDDYYEAVAVEHDSEAMLALVTDDFVLVSTDGVADRDIWAGNIESLFPDFAVERLGDPVVLGDGSSYVVSQPEHVSGTGIDEDAVSVLRVVEVDGTWLIGAHHYAPVEG